MRIAYISYELPPDIPQGGIGTYTIQAAALMSKAGHDVSIFCGSFQRSVTERVSGIITDRIKCDSPSDFNLKVAARFATVHREKAFDIVECPEIHGHGLLIKDLFPRLPMVVKLHGPNHLVELLKKTYQPFWTKARFATGALLRGKFQNLRSTYRKETDPDYCMAKSADLITAPSAGIKVWAAQQWKIYPKNISVVSNPFEAPVQFVRSTINDQYLRKQILFFGRLNVLKGLVNFTHALKVFLAEEADWDAVVIGNDGPGPFCEASMREWMKKQLNPFTKRLFFHDGMTQVRLFDRINEADIIVLPSLFETYSYTCAEAMAMGKAIVGSNRGGMQDLLERNHAGICVNPYRFREIYKAIKLLANDETLRATYAKTAKEFINRSDYNTTVLKQMTDSYQRALQSNPV